jgi:hypothetical protein
VLFIKLKYLSSYKLKVLRYFYLSAGFGLIDKTSNILFYFLSSYSSYCLEFSFKVVVNIGLLFIREGILYSYDVDR